MPTTKAQVTPDHNVDIWFNEVINHIKIDHFLISNNVASDETSSFYKDLIHGNGTIAMSQFRQTSTQFFIANIVNDYITELKSLKQVPLKLAMGLSDSKLLVWAEVEDEDEKTEDALLLAEAKVNAKYYQNGFFINSTIVEKSDNIEVPPHYKLIK